MLSLTDRNPPRTVKYETTTVTYGCRVPYLDKTQDIRDIIGHIKKNEIVRHRPLKIRHRIKEKIYVDKNY